MNEVNLYYFGSSNLKSYFSKLIESITEKGLRVMVFCSNKPDLTMIDDALWLYSSFLPHGTIYDELPEDQIVLISDNAINSYAANSPDIIIAFNFIPVFTTVPKQYQKLLIVLHNENITQDRNIDNINDVGLTVEQQENIKTINLPLYFIHKDYQGIWNKKLVY